ncbi:MAG: sulfite exporter TauE/SafE family protein [Desulfurococcales archaeon]|nr:sulfite exporter TauE/SafE family protein [Desulfurococcales archaeon]
MADYSAGLGYGLVAAVIVVSLADVDPRVMAGMTSLVQVLLAYPVVVQHARRGNIVIDKRYLRTAFIISISSSLGALVSMRYAITASRETIEGVFAIIIIVLLVISWLRKLVNREAGREVVEESWKAGAASSIAGFIAGVEKGISGGGFSIMLVLVQRLAGIDIKSAIAGLPVVKMIPFTIIGLGYIVFGFFNLELLISLFVGGLLSSLIAPRILGSIDEKVLLTTLTLLAAYMAVKLAL